MNIREVLQTKANDFPDKPAVIFKDQPVTFKELKVTVFSLARSLLRAGVGKGDKVAIYLPNWPEYIYSYLAVWCCGATAVPLDFMLTEDELVSCITHCEAKLLILKSKATLQIEVLKNKCPSLMNIALCHEKKEGCLSFEDLIAEGGETCPEIVVDDRDYAIIFYTSGTTGKPKGVLINYLQLEAPPKSMTFFVDFKDSDRALCAVPFSHLGGLIYIQNCIVFGITIVLMDRFIPAEYIKNISKYHVTCLWIVPSMYYALLHLKEFESFDLSSLRWMVIFGAPSSPDSLKRFYQYCPKAFLLHGWGLTETNAPTCVIPLGSKNVSSVGRPPPWVDVKIFDDADVELPTGTIGEIIVRGWVVTDGYFKDPVLTRETIRNGWFHTGDLGKFDTEGFLYICGRKKEMIKVAGEIVFEPEVEAAIHKHPAVAEAAVVGVPDKLRGEVPKAFVSFREGASATEEDLRYFCRQHLAHFKIPHYFEFVRELPKNRVGKIDKAQLRQTAGL